MLKHRVSLISASRHDRYQSVRSAKEPLLAVFFNATGNLGLLRINVNPESDTAFKCFGLAQGFLEVPQKAARALIAATATRFSIQRKINVAGPHLSPGGARLSLDISRGLGRSSQFDVRALP